MLALLYTTGTSLIFLCSSKNLDIMLLAAMVERRIGELFSDLDQLELASAPFKRSPDYGSALSVLLKDLADEKLNYRDYSMTVVDKLLNCDLIQSKEDKNLASSLEV